MPSRAGLRYLARTHTSPSAYNCDLSPCHAGTMANYARNSKLTNKRRFTRILQLVPSGDGFNLKARRIAVELSSLTWMIEMVSIKPEETLHEYLRRHFEKISR